MPSDRLFLLMSPCCALAVRHPQSIISSQGTCRCTIRAAFTYRIYLALLQSTAQSASAERSISTSHQAVVVTHLEQVQCSAYFFPLFLIWFAF